MMQPPTAASLIKLLFISTLSTNNHLWLSVSIIFHWTSNILAVQPRMVLHPNMSAPALYGFGDSIIDSGNNNNIATVTKSNFPPYGREFMAGGNPTGRFTNGKVPTDLLVDELGIKEYLPAYLDPNLKPEELLTGVCFASGASGYDPMTSKLASVISLSQQLKYFEEAIVKMKGMVGEGRTNFILANSLFLIVGGSDDIANTYFDTPFRRKEYDVDSYTNLLLNYATSFVKELYGLGARRIGVFGAPPVGCVPSQRTIGGGKSRACAENYNEMARLFNSKLSSQLDSMTNSLPKSKLVYIDIYNPLLDLIQNGTKYAEEMGIKPYLPAYLDPNLQPEELLTGVSFASGATGYDPKTAKIARALSLSDQIDMFKEYMEKVERMAGEERTKFILKASLFVVVAGSDDIANTYFGTPFRKMEYNISSYTDLLVNSASSFIQEIYKLGARRILVISAPPIGCLPSQRTIAGGLSRGCAEQHNKAAQLFNSKLSVEIESLNKRLLKSRVVYGDIYSPVLDMIQNPQQYGFQVVDKGCCGTGLLEVTILCNKFDPVCSDESKYLFWDSYHPSEAGYKIVVKYTLKVIRGMI